MTLNLAGRKFGRLVALEATPKRITGSVVWSCLCKCGRRHEASAQSLISGHVQSCRCLLKEAGQRTVKADRNAKLRRLHADGIGGKELASRFGITRSRVYQILDGFKKEQS